MLTPVIRRGLRPDRAADRNLPRTRTGRPQRRRQGRRSTGTHARPRRRRRPTGSRSTAPRRRAPRAGRPAGTATAGSAARRKTPPGVTRRSSGSLHAGPSKMPPMQDDGAAGGTEGGASTRSAIGSANERVQLGITKDKGLHPSGWFGRSAISPERECAKTKTACRKRWRRHASAGRRGWIDIPFKMKFPKRPSRRFTLPHTMRDGG